MTITRFETAFGGGWPWGPSEAHSKKPRVVWGSERLTTRLSELAGLVLAGQKGLFNSLAQFPGPLFLVGSGIRTDGQENPSLLRVAPHATLGA
jgi:hypothetical protein